MAAFDAEAVVRDVSYRAASQRHRMMAGVGSKRMPPGTVADWLDGRLPRPVEDVGEWQTDDE
jgi:hypothetical protein